MMNMQNMMKQAQKLQKQMEQSQAELAASQFVGKSAQDLVVATLTGDKKVVSIEFNPAVVDPEDTEKNDKGVTVVTRSGLIKLEEIYKKTIFEDEPVSDDVKQRELMEILVDEKNAEIVRLYEQLKAKDDQLKSKDEQLAKKDEQLRVKDVQIAEKDKQLDQQQQLTLQAMNDRETLKLELDQANEKVQEQESKGFWRRVFGR